MSSIPGEHVKMTPHSLGGSGEKPTGYEKTHPAFGMISFSRITGGDGKFFGSEVPSVETFFRMTVTEGSQLWDLSQNWFHGHGKNLIEVDMTAAQFVQLLTTLNVGSGVPCTVRSVLGVNKPAIIDDTTTHQLIREDLKRDVAEIVAKMDRLSSDLAQVLEESALSGKKKSDLVKQVGLLKQDLVANMPFVFDQYQRALDKQKSAHLAEVDVALTTMITNLGLKSLEQMKTLQQAAADQSPRLQE